MIHRALKPPRDFRRRVLVRRDARLTDRYEVKPARKLHARPATFNRLGLQATVEACVETSFGLGVRISATINIAMEVFMNSSLVIQTCVWCGVAFLRGLVGHYQSRREIDTG